MPHLMVVIPANILFRYVFIYRFLLANQTVVHLRVYKHSLPSPWCLTAVAERRVTEPQRVKTSYSFVGGWGHFLF